jgi:hypothetical protein
VGPEGFEPQPRDYEYPALTVELQARLMQYMSLQKQAAEYLPLTPHMNINVIIVNAIDR